MTSSNSISTPPSTPAAAVMPALYLPHGGGPAFFMQGPMAQLFDPMKEFLAALPSSLPEQPRAIVVVSAHWEAETVQVSSGTHHDLLFDYYGFPQETYSLTYPASGSPELADRVIELLSTAGIPAEPNSVRGWDHGVFIPLKVMYPEAEIPLVAMSLHAGLNAEEHGRIGAALRSLRQEGVLIIGSGMSYHNLSELTGSAPGSLEFDRYLDEALRGPGSHRRTRLNAWEDEPTGRSAHPREEHLIPLMVASAAGSDLPGDKIWAGHVGPSLVSAWSFS